MEKNYIHYPGRKVFAIYYANYKKLYYNLDFEGKTKLYILVW